MHGMRQALNLCAMLLLEGDSSSARRSRRREWPVSGVPSRGVRLAMFCQRLVWIGLVLLLGCGGARAIEFDWFVTDYNENPTPQQKALLDQPLVFPQPRRVTVETAEGRTVTLPSPATVSVRPGAIGDTREARLFVAPGEYEPFSFLFRPKTALSGVMIRSSALRGPRPGDHSSLRRGGLLHRKFSRRRTRYSDAVGPALGYGGQLD